jgi:F0F1-type ATP synthase assembly protein I
MTSSAAAAVTQQNGENFLDNQGSEPQPISPKAEKVKKLSSTTALAFELPFTIVGALVVGGVVGYFLDQAFHTKMIFTVILGVLGFAGGLVEAIRRLP